MTDPRQRRPGVDPFEALARWEDLAERCSVVGYDASYDELTAERSVRSELDVLIWLMAEQPGFFDSGTTRTVRHRLAAADEAWLSGGQPDPRAEVGAPEWAQFVPTLASGELAEDLARIRSGIASAWGDFRTRVLRRVLDVDFRDPGAVEAALRPRVGQMSPLLRERVADYLAAGANPNPNPTHWIDGGVRDLLEDRFHVYVPDDWLTDGVFLWRPPAAEYVRHHGIGLPAEVIEHLRSRDWSAPVLTEPERESLWRRIEGHGPEEAPPPEAGRGTGDWLP